MNVEANLVIQGYTEKVAELSHENIMLKAYIKQLESKEGEKEYPVVKGSPVE